MKPLLPLLFGCLFSSAAFAQTTQPFSHQFEPKVTVIPQNKSSLKPFHDSTGLLIPSLGMPAKKPSVYRLRGGMPCIVPDTKDVAAMPNAWRAVVRTPYKSNPPRIPNQSPLQLAPDSLKTKQ